MRARAQAAPVVRAAAVTLPTRADGSVCLGVVADTHSRPHPATVDLLRALSPDAILHAGDIGDLGVLETLAAVAPVHAVRGNIDVRAPELPDELTIDLVHDGARVLRILLVHIAVNGPACGPMWCAPPRQPVPSSSCAATRTFRSSARTGASSCSTPARPARGDSHYRSCSGCWRSARVACGWNTSAARLGPSGRRTGVVSRLLTAANPSSVAHGRVWPWHPRIVHRPVAQERAPHALFTVSRSCAV
jgi:hypothetical protein